MKSGQFTLEDFANQLKSIRKMGPFSQILDMLPGNLGNAARNISPQDAEKQLKLTEAIINSMTVQERRHPDVLNASRRRRIARGSGTDVQDVNRILKQFREAQRLFKTIQKSGGRGLSSFFR
jgi:signal recognition particle subunit SRP54